MKPKVYVTREIPKSGIDILKSEFDVAVNPHDRVLTKKEIIENAKDKAGLLTLLTDSIDAEVMDALPNIKVISNYAVGFNNIDVEAATKRGIIVTNTPGVLTETTADFAFSLLMSIARRIPEADRYTREGKFRGWEPMLFLGRDIYGKTLGILGLGRIGKAVAKRAKGFDMKIIYYDEFRSKDAESELGIEYVPFERLIKESDYISIHVPLLPSTKHMIGSKELSMMKPSAAIVNTARGPVIDEHALIEALRDKKIFGAALDVFDNEPAVPDELRKLDNVILAPHIASASFETRSLMSELAAKNMAASLSGKMPPALVNKEVIGKSRIKIMG